MSLPLDRQKTELLNITFNLNRKQQNPEPVLGNYAGLIEDSMNVKGFHGVIGSVLPDPENPDVDQVIQEFNPRLKKVVRSASEKFNFLNLSYKPGFRKDECQVWQYQIWSFIFGDLSLSFLPKSGNPSLQ